MSYVGKILEKEENFGWGKKHLWKGNIFGGSNPGGKLGLFTGCTKYRTTDSILFDIPSINLALPTSPSLPRFIAANIVIGHLFCSDSSFNSLISPTAQFFYFGEFHICWS